jgi:nanoRNase/pAp phosphatase (c-di-AMP/oligoRNAs hydrolase)
MKLTQEEPHVGILLHPNPDPDCIASAMGLTKILQFWNPHIKCTMLYSGEISHSQNKTLVNVLNVSLTSLAEIENLKDYADVFVVVDAIAERCLPEDCDIESVLMTIDHHRVETEKSQFYDIRQVGAVSSIIWEYMSNEKIGFDKANDQDAIVATALLVGIKTDTYDLVSENVTDLDFTAYRHLIEHVNRRHLSAIINYPIPAYYFELRSQLDRENQYRIDNGVFVGGVGFISASKRDTLPMMAEERSRAEGIQTAIIFAIVEDHLEVSVRSAGVSVDVNALCQKIFGKQYAGGKMGAGAAKIPMGFFSIVDATEDTQTKMWESAKDFMIEKIFAVIA